MSAKSGAADPQSSRQAPHGPAGTHAVTNLLVVGMAVGFLVGRRKTTKTPGSVAKEGLMWRVPERLGHQETLKGLGGVVAPFLAGFSLSTIAILVAADHPPKLANPAILALAAAASMLLYSMQVAFLSLEHEASPVDWLAWYPEATVNRLSLESVRERQAAAHERVIHFERRHAITYEIGLLLFLGGLWLLVWPVWPAKGNPPILRILALIVVALAFFIEVWWMGARLYNGRQERTKTEKCRKYMAHPAAWHKATAPVVRPSTSTGIAGVLDSERREAAKLDFPNLSIGPGAEGR